MANEKHVRLSLSEVHGSIDTTQVNRPWWRKMLSFFGPAYLVSVGYMDPGNWATGPGRWQPVRVQPYLGPAHE